ncbi:hypothetical protein EV294_102700 [Paenibacillus sp. BK033]|uniref:hypothetical protein n=1 Tax=Paenibacillus sp. BK033 TaxID=2512133 RepID=UPI00104AD895|nr:hypothetical protein [Paenibacillus sp. BK033]TCM99404.1 hypothetical protein EV294_102700 [Paenibacillus sp. BK033]
MKKKTWIIAAALFAVVATGSGSLLHSTYAASGNNKSSVELTPMTTNSDNTAVSSTQEKSDGDGEVADDQVKSSSVKAANQEKSDGDGEVADDQEQSDKDSANGVDHQDDGETNED